MPSLYKALYCTLLFTHQYTDYSVFLSHFILLTVATSRKAKDKKKKEKKKKKRKKERKKRQRAQESTQNKRIGRNPCASKHKHFCQLRDLEFTSNFLPILGKKIFGGIGEKILGPH